MRAVKFLVVGGAGFIGSHFADHLLGDLSVAAVTLFDNFSSGREWHSERHAGDRRLRLVRGDAGDLSRLTEAMAGHEVVIHLAVDYNIIIARLTGRRQCPRCGTLYNVSSHPPRVEGVRRLPPTDHLSAGPRPDRTDWCRD